MNINELKKYVARAVELETAVYTQKRIMDDYQNALMAQCPPHPQRGDLQLPRRPMNQCTYEPTKEGKTFNVVICIMVLLGCVVFIAAVPALGILMTIGCIVGLIVYYSGIEKQKEEAREYEVKMQEYERQMSVFNELSRKDKERYANEMEVWNKSMDAYNQKNAEIYEKNDELLKKLESVLQAHYAENIIFPKYRNMVAIATINEYLMSGRCNELEGVNGAYNLYEMELRQNIIIGQLSYIIDSLDQIRNNQYLLYSELLKANSLVENILDGVRGIEHNTRLTAYFAGVTAMIEASPKVYVGRTF